MAASSGDPCGVRGAGAGRAGDLIQTRLGNSLGLRLSPVGEQGVWWQQSVPITTHFHISFQAHGRVAFSWKESISLLGGSFKSWFIVSHVPSAPVTGKGPKSGGTILGPEQG